MVLTGNVFRSTGRHDEKLILFLQVLATLCERHERLGEK
jgi:hypothetical protein